MNNILRGLTAALIFSSLTFAAGSANAALVLTDHPQGASFDTFYNSLTDIVVGNAPQDPNVVGQNRFSLDAGDTASQSFTLSAATDIDSIYYAYNDQQSTGTFDLNIDVNNNGTADHTFVVNVPNTLQAGGGNGGPVHFLQFDISSENIQLPAGVHSFGVEGTLDNGEGAWLIAPLHNLGDQFAGGEFTQQTADGGDAIFAITGTVVPEPGSLALMMFGIAGIATSRRRR